MNSFFILPPSSLFNYPQKAAFGRVLPKTKIYAFGKTTRRLRDLFAAQVDKIIWRYKLAPETINIPAGPDVTEIQIFGIELKPGVEALSEDVLRCIDNAIAFPIFFEVTTPAGAGHRIKIVTAYKRQSEADGSKCVVGDYLSTGWLSATAARSPLPIALTLSGLYEQMLRQLMPIGARPGESFQQLAERHRCVALKRRECEKVAAQLQRERQFNRKVEINAQLRTIKAELDALTQGPTL